LKFWQRLFRERQENHYPRDPFEGISMQRAVGKCVRSVEHQVKGKGKAVPLQVWIGPEG